MSATGRTEGIRHENDLYETPPYAVEWILDEIGSSFRRYGHGLMMRPTRILDPGCGTGSILRTAKRWFENHNIGTELHGIDNDPVAMRHGFGGCEYAVAGDAPATGLFTLHEGDFTTYDWRGKRFDLSIGNPPYETETCTAFDFVRRSFEIADTTCFLLRTNWLEGAREREPERKIFIQQNLPDVYELSKRPSFCTTVSVCKKCGGTGTVALAEVGMLAKANKCKRCAGKGEVKTSTDATSYAWVVFGGPLGGGHFRLLG